MGTSFRSGFNRIGLYFDQTLNLDFNGHQCDAGIRYYGPDFVFEKNTVGFSLGYNYNFSTSNIYFGPGLSTAFFKENKTNSDLFLTELMINNKFGISAGERLSFFSQIGIGAVINKHTNYNSGAISIANTSYLNYEIVLGIKYYWRVPADN